MIGSPKEDPEVQRDGNKADDGDAVQKHARDSDEDDAFFKDDLAEANPDATDYDYAQKD